MLPHERAILRPYDARETITVQQACGIAGRVTPETMRRWTEVLGIGRKIAGRVKVSHPALLMHLDGDMAALDAYHSGDRTGDAVRGYFSRAGIV